MNAYYKSNHGLAAAYLKGIGGRGSDNGHLKKKSRRVVNCFKDFKGLSFTKRKELYHSIVSEIWEFKHTDKPNFSFLYQKNGS